MNSTGGGVSGIILRDNITGPITVGVVGDAPGDAGTISGNSGAAVVIDNSANVTISGLQIDTTAGQTGVEVTKDTTGTQITNLNDLEINGGANGIDVIGNGTGTLNMTVNDSTINNATARGCGSTTSTPALSQSMARQSTVTTRRCRQGVEIIGQQRHVTFDADTLIQEFVGTISRSMVARGTSPTTAISPTRPDSRSTSQNRTGGSVQFSSTSMITDSGAGILVENNGTGSISFLGTNDLDTTTNTAVTLTNNDVGGTNATMTFASLDITSTGTGRG